MQQIGSIARAVLADIKRAKEARDRELADGCWVSAPIAGDQPTLSRVSAESGDQNPNACKGFVALKDSGRQSTPDREDAGDHTHERGGNGRGLVCGQVDSNRQNAGPREGFSGVNIACPHRDADTISSGFTVPQDGNAHRRR